MEKTARRPAALAVGIMLISLFAVVACGPDNTEPEKPVIAPNTKVDVTVLVTGLRSDQGHLIAVLCQQDEAFPNDCRLRQELPVDDSRTTELVFKDIPAGIYAFACFHDENDNRFIDMNQGFPAEGLGFSNNAIGMAGPPAYERSSFEAYQDVSTTLRLRYMGPPPASN